MDFVELVNEDQAENPSVGKLASYLTTGDDDSNSDDMDEDSDDEMQADSTFRSKVAQAEDFDFKAM